MKDKHKAANPATFEHILASHAFPDGRKVLGQNQLKGMGLSLLEGLLCPCKEGVAQGYSGEPEQLPSFN